MNNIQFPVVKPVEESAFFALFTKNYVTKPAASVEAFTKKRASGASPYGQKALDNECAILAGTPEGGRNHQLNKSAFSIGQLVAAGEISADLAAEALRNAARASGLGDHEIETTLRSGGQAGQNQPRIIPEQTTGDWPEVTLLHPANKVTPVTTIPTPIHPASEDEETADDLTSLVHARLPIIDWEELWADDEEEEWILYPLIAKRRGTVIYSPPKVGKSLFVLEMAVHISEGTPWLGVEIDQPHNVLYVDFENDPRGDVRTRLQAMGFTPANLTNLKYLSFPAMSGLDTAQGASQLLSACKVYDCDIVIIDTISRAVDGDENENDTWLSFYRQTGLALKQNEITMVRLDHTGKDESKGQRGGSAKSGDVDAIWKMTKATDEGDIIRLHLDDSRMQIGERDLIIERVKLPHLHHKVNGSGSKAAWDAKVQEIVNFLDQHDADPEMGRNRARDLLKTTGLTASNRVLEEALRVRKERPYGVARRLEMGE